MGHQLLSFQNDHHMARSSLRNWKLIDPLHKISEAIVIYRRTSKPIYSVPSILPIQLADQIDSFCHFSFRKHCQKRYEFRYCKNLVFCSNGISLLHLPSFADYQHRVGLKWPVYYMLYRFDSNPCSKVGLGLALIVTSKNFNLKVKDAACYMLMKTRNNLIDLPVLFPGKFIKVYFDWYWSDLSKNLLTQDVSFVNQSHINCTLEKHNITYEPI